MCPPATPTPSSSGISTMGNYQSDVSTAVSPDSPAVFYSSAAGVRFRGFRKDDTLREEEQDLLTNGSISEHERTDQESSDGLESHDDETRGLLHQDSSSRVHSRLFRSRSPSSIRHQLTIEIPSPVDSGGNYHQTLSSTSSELDCVSGPFENLPSGDELVRDISFDGQSVGGLSLVPNFSPTSLHEKNMRLVDDEPTHPLANSSDQTFVIQNTIRQNPLDDSIECDPRETKEIVDTPHGRGIQRAGPVLESPCSAGGSDSSRQWEGSSSRTQSEYLSSDTLDSRSRSMSPELMNILAKYRTSRDSSRGTSPDYAKHSTPISGSESGVSESPGLDKIGSDDWTRKRRHYLKHSFSSVSSEASSLDFSSRDITLRAHSLDLTENLSGIQTPESDLFSPGDVGLKTAASMEHIQKELHTLEREIADMNTAMAVLSSQENLTNTEDSGVKSDSSREGSFQSILRVLSRHRRGEDSVMSRSLSFCDEEEEEPGMDRPTWRHSYSHTGQYVWDYHSDLGTTNSSRHRGVDHWGTLDESSETSRETSVSQSPTFGDIRSHLRQSLESSTSMDIAPNSSIADLYIDDDLTSLTEGQDRQLPLQLASGTSFSSGMKVSPTRGPKGSRTDVTCSETDSPDSSPHSDQTFHQTSGDLSTSQGQKRLSVGTTQEILAYSDREWKGTTPTAEIIRQGYKEIHDSLGFHSLRQVRGDNYCALRATLFQAFLAGLPLVEQIGTKDEVLQKLSQFQGDSHYRHHWTFGRRLPLMEEGEPYTTACKCIDAFYDSLQQVQAQTDPSARDLLVEHIFNTEEEVDLLLMEAVKLFMLLSALELYKLQLEGADVPTFAVLMFARDTSSNIESFVQNHLNCVGDSGGLEQVEMFLLSHVLDVSIRVIRPSQFGNEDFVTYYANEADVSTSTPVNLVAEDDRHYNILS